MLSNKPFTFFWHFVKKYKFLYSSILIFDVFIVFANIFLANYFLKNLIDILVSESHKIAILYKYVGLFILFSTINYFTSWIFNYFYRYKILDYIVRDIRISVFDYVSKHSLSYFNDNIIGGILQKIDNLQMEDFLEHSKNIIGKVVLMAIYIIFIVQKNYILYLYLILWTIFFSALFLIIKKKIANLWGEIASADKKVKETIGDSFTSINTVKSFVGEGFEKNNLVEKEDALLKLMRKPRVLRGFLSIIMGSMIALFLFFILKLSINEYLANNITIGAFTMRVGISIFLVSNLIEIFNYSLHLVEKYGRFRGSLKELIVPHLIENYSTEQHNLTAGEIELKDIGFKYQENLPLIFDGFNLTIKSSEKVGLVGYSGAGKSSLISLLLRFYDVNSGAIIIDGINIKTEISQESLRRNISFIPQDPILFHRSIRENLVYGNAKATEEELIEACKKACCYDFILGLENCFETLVGERGVKLSGGQRQRIAIARAILKNSKILILDEATSSLDSITENEIQIALTNLMKDKTVIVVAHRLSTLNNMDRIIVLDKGSIKEDGTKDELLSLENGLFKKMWDMQKGGKLDLE